MEKDRNNPNFPKQDESIKIHGVPNEEEMKEKYIRGAGKIEDYPEQDEAAKMKSNPNGKNESSHLTDASGEEKKEDYINTDERKRDLDGRSS